MNDNHISIRQFQLLVIFYTIGTSILIIPSSLAADAKQDAWLASICGVSLGLFVVWLYVKVGAYMQGNHFTPYSTSVIGSIAGSAVTALLGFYCFIGSVTLLSYVGHFMTTQIFTNTPIQFIHILFALLVVMALRLGLETIARAAEIFFPWFTFLFLALTVFLTPKMNMENLQPILYSDTKSLLRASLNLASVASMPMIAFVMVFPYINNQNKLGKAFFSATSVGGLFIIGISLLSIAVLGAEMTERLVFPSYALAKKINVGDFIQRVESIAAALWIISIFFKLVLYAHSALSSLIQILRLQHYRSLVLPYGLLLVIYGNIVYPNVNFMKEWDTNTWIPFAITMGIVIPLILLLASWVKSKSRRLK